MIHNTKKVGIVTFTYGNNYGQRLQNYAVQQLLTQYAEEVYTLRAVPPKLSLKKNLRNFYRTVRKHDLFSIKKRSESFRKFDDMFIVYNDFCVNNGILENESEFDFFVAGSDQIWSPFSPDVNDSMFLTFTTPEKRIALSPSIAANEIPVEKEEQYKRYFEGFSHLSVREEKGAELIRQISGRKAEVLADPTLALHKREWEKLADKSKVRISKKYIFVYCLGDESKNGIISEYAKVNQCMIIDIMSKNFFSLGPCEFLWLLRNAQIVFTDSYHATIFSCIFHVPFVVLGRKGARINMTSRFDTLFKKLGIINRTEETIQMSRIDNMDFSDIDGKIFLEQKSFTKYLEMVFCKTFF